MKSLQVLMLEQLPAGGVSIPHGRAPHIEVIEKSTGRVWMGVDAATRHDYEQLLDVLGDAYHGLGIGSAVMDAALFQYSPGGEGEPVFEREIGGHRFINVAIPGDRVPLPCGITEVPVHKAHVLGFEAGRALVILRLPEGDFVEVVGDPERDAEITLPEGGRFETLVLEEPWVVALPNPTTTLWSFATPLRSFQGPVIPPWS